MAFQSQHTGAEIDAAIGAVRAITNTPGYSLGLGSAAFDLFSGTLQLAGTGAAGGISSIGSHALPDVLSKFRFLYFTTYLDSGEYVGSEGCPMQFVVDLASFTSASDVQHVMVPMCMAILSGRYEFVLEVKYQNGSLIFDLYQVGDSSSGSKKLYATKISGVKL